MSESLRLAVNGTLMQGLELNKNLLEVGAIFEKEARTEPIYRLFSIQDIHPAMLQVSDGGKSVALEIWLVPLAGLANILSKEPAGLCVGKVKLDGGGIVLGVIGESICCEQGKDISEYGGWRKYKETLV